MPDVTVLMTVYNGMPYLKKAVDSVLQQTHEDFVFVIVDDGSTDGTSQFLADLDDPRVVKLHQENQGTAVAANLGLKSVTTRFVARMDADDIAMSDRLEKQFRFMTDNPDVGIDGAQVAPVGERGHGNSLALPTDHRDIFHQMMAGRHGLAHSSIMIRTEVLKELGGYWSLPLIDDWDMMLRVGEVSKLANINEVLLHYRVHAGSLNGSSMWRMHRHISYAIDRAKRRQSSSQLISFEEFEQQLDRRPFLQRFGEIVHVHAMTHYRLAVAELYGGHKIKGTARLGYAALCSPSRTFHRFGRWLSKSKANSAKRKSKADPSIA